MNDDDDWRTEKAESNIKKHGLSFDEAAEVFDDPFYIEMYDKNHSTIDEDRFNVIDRIKNQMIVSVVYMPRDGKRRIITARYALKKEWRLYYDRRRSR